MGVMTSKMGTAAGMAAQEPRRRSLFGKLSVLLAGSSEHAGRVQDDSQRGMDLRALRQRMTPSGPVQSVPAAIRTKQPEDLPPMQASPVTSVSDYAVPWSNESVEQEWKPVLLADEAVTPAIPSLDDLADEAGIDPSKLRFPIDS